MTPETPTPETDDLAVVCYGESGIEGGNGFCAVPIKECRRLERERDAARAENEVMKEAIQEAHKIIEVLYMDALDSHKESWPRANEWLQKHAAFAKLKPFIKL